MFLEKDIKVNRILSVYIKLQQGGIVNKKDLSRMFNVNEKTIQRDIEDIRNYLYENFEVVGNQDIIYRRDLKGYCFKNKSNSLSREQILVILKILLESRALCREELDRIKKTLINNITDDERRDIDKIIGNEFLNYVPTQNSSNILDKIWWLSSCIRQKEIIKIMYEKVNGIVVERKLKPISIIFSEYYFYLIAYYKNYDFPTVFRIDRIKIYNKIEEKFHMPEKNRFEDGEFRKRVQFMYSGELQKIKFEFTGKSIEAVLDRLPTARIVNKEKSSYILEAEVYGTGIIMWILSQGSKIKLIEPDSLVKELYNEIEKMQKYYTLD